VATHTALPTIPPVKKEGTAWETPLKPAKVLPTPAAGRTPKVTGPKHFHPSQSGEEENEGGEEEEADTVQTGIDKCTKEVERLKALIALLEGSEKPDDPFFLQKRKDLTEWEDQLLTLRGVKKDELPYEARTARLIRQIKEVQAKASRSRILREEASDEVLAAQAKHSKMREQYDRQKKKGAQLQLELDEVSKKRPPVFQDTRSEESSDGGGSTCPALRSRSPAPRPTPFPPAHLVVPGGTPAPLENGTALLVPTNGLPSGSGGPLAESTPGGKLDALMAAGRKRRNTGSQKGKSGRKAQAKSQHTGTGEDMSDILGDDDEHSDA
jgi:hypothetical protein